MDEASTVSTAEGLLRALKARGIDYVLANAGTDFAPVIEGLKRRRNEAGLLGRARHGGKIYYNGRTSMAITYTDLIASVRKQVREVSLDELKRRLDAKESYTLLDVREKEEYRAGFIPGALSIPRGFLEIQVEGRLRDKNAKIVAYCAGGTRSALAAKTLAELGYEDLARRRHAAQQLHINQAVTGGERPELLRPAVDWLAPAYWESDTPRKLFSNTWLAGHAFKLPYSLFRMLRLTDDAALREACLVRATRLQVPFE